MFLLILSDIYEKITAETYDLSCNHVAVVYTSRDAIAEALTKNDKRSEGNMNTEKGREGRRDTQNMPKMGIK
jgi:hypothetical protein